MNRESASIWEPSSREARSRDSTSRHEQRRRILPFAAVAALALASLALPPGPTSNADAFGSVGLLLLSAVLLRLPISRTPGLFSVLIPVTYSFSVLLLVLAAGGSTSGIGIIILLPLVWTALYHEPWESAIVVVVIVAVEVITSLTPVVVPLAVIARRVVFWTAIGALISVAAQDLRQRVRVMLASREEAHLRAVALEKAAETLTAILQPDEVLEAAVRVAAEMVSPEGMSGRRAQYMRLDGPTVTVVVEYDETGQHLPATYPLAEHPILAKVFETRVAITGHLDARDAGPLVASYIKKLDVTHGLYLPVLLFGDIDGVLSVSLRGKELPDELFELSKALMHVIELALSNAQTHKLLEDLASTDELTGLPNRREFNRLTQNRPGRFSYVILAMDLDGLKKVNDSQGHAAGDALLRRVANVLQTSLRAGDVVARLGGDEFAAILFQADESDGRIVCERILAALAESPLGNRPSLSIGIATGASDSDVHAVRAAADNAMYRAKQRGGGCYELASGPTLVLGVD
jgi:diguanylate cyclase (GGDEF)-like protein